MKNTISLKALLLPAISLFSINLLAQNSDIETKAEAARPLIERYPMEGINRPGVMPTGIINVETGLSFSEFKNAAGKMGAPIIGLKLGTQFGIVDKVEGQLSYDGVEFNKFSGTERKAFVPKRTINIGTKYNYFSIPHVSFSASANLPFHILDNEILTDVTIGLPVVFYNSMMAGSLLGDVLNIKMRPNVELEFKFKYWYGAQVYGNWWAMVSSSFGKVKMSNPNNQAEWQAKWFWQELPVDLSVLYVFNHYLDLSGNIGFDNVLKAKETLQFGLTFAFRGGRLFG